jgi:glycine/D-amino acid oxidase-like deaminating enzyme
VLDPEPAAGSADAAIRSAQTFFPRLAGVPVAQRWAGLIDVTPDALPVISPIDGHDGFFIATGFSGHGFGIAPAAGRLCADLVMGNDPIVDPSPFRFSRFCDGTPIRPMSSV